LSNDNKNRVCPVELAGGLDNRVRRWIQNPKKILAPYVKDGMQAMDVGCGPGFFSVEMAQLVGKRGKVIAADLQDGMLEKLKLKIQGTPLAERIVLHKSEPGRVGHDGKVDFILAFYMVHEVPDKVSFFKEMKSYLNPDGLMLIVEPAFHVSGVDFKKTLAIARDAGLSAIGEPKMLLSRVACLKILEN
jgi:ubiquinone/menaquinone biosynthesis C-methylase UbiE